MYLVVEASAAEECTMKTWQWIIGALIFITIIGLALWLTPKLPDAALFWLKLFSFIATAAFGVIGVITDFKDDKRKLTLIGKVNLATLVLAALIGVIAQKAENDNSRSASERENKALRGLNDQNQEVLSNVASVISTNSVLLKNSEISNQITRESLHQGLRNLELFGDKITVHYVAQLDLHSAELQGVNEYIGAKLAEVIRDGYSRDEHTKVFAITPTVLEADFDDISELMPKEKVARTFLTSPMFSIAVYKQKPKRQKTDHSLRQCWNREKEDLLLIWDRETTRSFESPMPIAATKLFESRFWKPNTGIMEQHGYGMFKVFVKNPEIVSAVDFEGKYAVLFVANEAVSDITVLSVQIGPRHFELHDLFEKDECGNRLFAF
jgi:hypothetical protein